MLKFATALQYWSKFGYVSSLTTTATKQSPYWQHKTFLSESRNSPNCRELGCSLPRSQEPVICLHPQPHQSSPRQDVSFPQVSQLSCPPTFHTSPTFPFFSIESKPQYLVRSTNHAAPQCAISISPLLPLLDPNILLSTPFSKTLILRSFFFCSVAIKVSTPHKTTGNITVLYVLMCSIP